jgi:hypothetical protein
MLDPRLIYLLLFSPLSEPLRLALSSGISIALGIIFLLIIILKIYVSWGNE